MTFNPEIHHRHSIRLRNYDYSRPGYYFVTLCAYHRECIFGDIEKNEIVLNELGTLVKKNWYDLPVHFPGIELDKMVIMPNHLHGIIKISDHCRGGVIPPLGVFPPIKIVPMRSAVIAPKDGGKTLGQMIAWFKYESTKEINRVITGNPEMKIWQRNFYERIVRNDEELSRIRNYIATNLETWKEDENYTFVGAGLSRPWEMR
ncbi:MAG: transposase [Acidobacteria bacterium]|nr:transposase [Acidobacteriota bacterium]